MFEVSQGKQSYSVRLGVLTSKKSDKSIFWGGLLAINYKGNKEAAWKDYLAKSKKKKK